MVRAKFMVTETTCGRVRLQAVTDDSEENKQFFEATPAGDIDLQVVSADTVARFEVGQEFYVDFTPCG